jgi:DUF1009 family protein
MTTGPQASKLGIVAGAGALPGLLAASCRATARPCFVLGLTGFADPVALGQSPDAWIRLGEAGSGFELMRKAGVAEIVMAGAVRRPPLADLRPDLKTAAFFARIAGRALGDDSLMRAVVAEIEREGFRVVGPDQILASLLAPAGVLGAHAADRNDPDVLAGIAAAHDLGRRDAGQAVVVRDGRTVGEEDEAGTAALIRRCTPCPGGVLVKMKKPQQDRRVDLPVIGPETVAQAHAAGLRGIAIEAGGCLVLDLPRVRADADAAGLFLLGVTP